MKKMFCLLIIVFTFACIETINAETSKMLNTSMLSVKNSIVSINGNEVLTDDFLADDNWWKSVEKDYSEYYGKNWKEKIKKNGIASDNAEKIRKLYQNYGEEDVSFPNYIGGIYINQNDDLVIQIVKKNLPKSNSIEFKKYNEMLGIDENAVIDFVNFSDEEINSVYAEALEKIQKDNLFKKIGISKMYIDTINNNIVVELLNYCDDTISEFKNKVFDSEIITFKKGLEVRKTLNAGGAIGGCSVGYRARKTSSGKGFVTAGHCYCNGTNISNYGVVQNRQFSGKIDAAWINSAGTSLTITNTLHNWSISGSQALPSPATITTTVVTPTVGQAIGRVGQTTGHRLGTISSVGVSFNVTDGDSCLNVCPTMTYQIMTTVTQDYGDSGGIVYLSSNRATLGIGTFKELETNHMIFNSAKNINSTFGISRY